jgi:hypothetical protein
MPYLINYLRDVEGYSADEIWTRIVDHANANDVTIPTGTREYVFGPRPRGQQRIRPLEIVPAHQGEVRADGQIMSVNQVNFFSRFNLVDNVMGRALLREFATERYLEITLREDPDEETGFSNQYTFFVRQGQFVPLGLGQNSRATAILITRYMINRRIWLAESIDHPW